MNISNNWRIGSITKTITAEAVLILADEGKIDLNKSLSFYFPEYKIPSGEKITIRMLGNMTSGLYDYTKDYDWNTSYNSSNGQKMYTPEELAAIVFNNPIQYEPGTKYYYNNSNFLVLGLLIKKVAGKEVIDVFNEKIFQPLGMKNTFWPVTRYMPFPYSHGYSLDNDVTNLNPSWADAAGILISNLSDLKIWAKELGERKLLSEKMKGERFAWVDSDAPGLYSGFGLEKNSDWVGHPGDIYGYNSQIWYNPTKKITVIVTTNSTEGLPTNAVLGEFMNILTPFK
jgi:D-alanyl-D-alanine carboxypeptidase